MSDEMAYASLSNWHCFNDLDWVWVCTRSTSWKKN